MKIVYAVAGLIVGIIVGHFASPPVGRFQMETTSGGLWRVDTATGKTWAMQGGWVLIGEQPPKLFTDTDEFGGKLVNP